MREHMSKEAYLDHCRSAIVQTAAEMLDGRVDFLIGSRKLRSLLIEVGLNFPDPELMVLTAIDSETDALPLGDVRQHWDEGALRRLEPEIQDAERWARDVGSPACVALIRRFEEGPSPMAHGEANG
jgi:hypothetical protein